MNFRMLWMSNAPWATSAYAGQTRLHVPRVRELIGGRENMALFPFYGLQGGPLRWDGMLCYPCGVDMWGMDIVEAHAKHHKADVVLCNMDSWKVQPEMFGDVPYVVRFPVDMQPLSEPIKKAITPALVRIVESRFGERMVTEAGLDCVYVPAAVDTKVFTPTDTAAAREALGWGNLKDKFIVGMVATNRGGGHPSRKGFEAAFRAFAQFKQTYPDALLYLHCSSGEAGEHGSINLWNLAEMEGIMPSVLFPEFYPLLAGHVTDPNMALLYSAFDVLLCSSMGEGVCVPLIEAQACGTPVIAPSWTATDELVFAGWKLYENEPFPFADFKAYMFSPRSEEVANVLATAYQDLSFIGAAKDFAERARAGVLQFDIDYITEYYWPAALQQIEERLTARRRCPCGGEWAAIGWFDGAIQLTPCTNPTCTNAIRTDRRTNTHTLALNSFPMEVDGIPLDIEDTPPGAVAKIVAREATASYALHEMEFEPGDIVIDIGAHVGVMSIYLAKKRPDLQVYAFEPHPLNYLNLLRNIKANGLQNVYAFNTAVSADGRELTLAGDYTQNTGGMGLCNTRDEHAERVIVQSKSIADVFALVASTQIGLLKIDCEGAEYEVLGAAMEQGLLDTVDRLVGEFHVPRGQPEFAQQLLEQVNAIVPFVRVGMCEVS